MEKHLRMICFLVLTFPTSLLFRLHMPKKPMHFPLWCWHFNRARLPKCSSDSCWLCHMCCFQGSIPLPAIAGELTSAQRDVQTKQRSLCMQTPKRKLLVAKILRAQLSVFARHFCQWSKRWKLYQRETCHWAAFKPFLISPWLAFSKLFESNWLKFSAC